MKLFRCFLLFSSPFWITDTGSCGGVSPPSLETGLRIDSWIFTGPEDGGPDILSAEDPFDGSRCLRIDARFGTRSWESLSIGVEPERRYLLHWMTKYWGEKVWRFRSDFCGIEVDCLDPGGERLITHSRHSHCWQTLGWRPAWFSFETPHGTASIRVRFVIRTAEPLPGGFDIDLVELYPVPAEGEFKPNLLSVRVVDEMGKLTGARMRIERLDGVGAPPAERAVLPRASVVYAMDDYSFHSLEPGLCEVQVDPGTYRLTVTKGFEYTPIKKDIEIPLGGEILVELKHDLNWEKRGWVCGDHHVHLHRHGGSMFPSLTYEDVLRFAGYEDLDFLPFMGADKYPAPPRQREQDSENPPLQYELTDEITEDFWGHVCPIGVSPDCQADSRYDEGPMNLDRFQSFAGEDGILAYAHPYGAFPAEGEDLSLLADLRSGLVAREFPIDLALGMACSFDLLTMEGDRNRLERKLRDLYRLYNLGFRFGLSASTDFHVEQGRQPLGSVRTYVRPERLDLKGIADCYSSGRTFCTNGPLIDFKVNGMGPGSEINMDTSSAKIEVELEAASIGRLHGAEVIVNGTAVMSLRETEPGRIHGTATLALDRSSWVALKVTGPEEAHLAASLEGRPLGAGQFAHTSPVYLLLNNLPIRAAKPLDAKYFIAWCNAVEEAWEAHLKRHPDQERHDNLVRNRLARARSVFEDLGEF